MTAVVSLHTVHSRFSAAFSDVLLSDSMERVDQAYARALFDQGSSDVQISSQLRSTYPEITRGLAERSVRAWRLKNGLSRYCPMPDVDVDNQVRWAVGEIGQLSGRRFVKGYLESFPHAEKVAERRIGNSLKRCFPDSHASRLDVARTHLNPVPYHADYFGHKLHIDQNEKLTAFGATHVVAIDGYSGFIVAHATMPVKNNVIIYDKIFCESIRKYGLWDQIVVDAGSEFNLTLSYQDYLQNHRHNQIRKPYLQIKSTANNRIERVWSEVNSRVNYPLKGSLENMVDQGLLDINDRSHLFASSLASQAVAEIGLQRLFRARNHRPLRTRRSQRLTGGTTPTQLMLGNDRAARIDQTLLASPSDAAQAYRDGGGSITEPQPFGTDPLLGDVALTASREQLISNYPFCPGQLYSLAANGQTAAFQAFVGYVIDVNRALSNQ